MSMIPEELIEEVRQKPNAQASTICLIDGLAGLVGQLPDGGEELAEEMRAMSSVMGTSVAIQGRADRVRKLDVRDIS